MKNIFRPEEKQNKEIMLRISSNAGISNAHKLARYYNELILLFL